MQAPRFPGEQIIVLSHVLASRLTVGFTELVIGKTRTVPSLKILGSPWKAEGG